MPPTLRRADFSFREQQNEQTTDCIVCLDPFKVVEKAIGRDRIPSVTTTAPTS
jgi:hypothetical protein